MRWAGSVVFACAIGASLFQVGRADDAAGTFPLAADSVLQHWETASQGLLGVGPLETRRLYHLYQATHSAHEISLLNEFRGPVRAMKLKQRFEWSVQHRGKEVVLHASPTDELEKLFFDQVTVTLDAKTHLPKTVRFQGRDSKGSQEELAVVMSPRIDEEPRRFMPDETARPIQVASRESESAVRVASHVTLVPVPQPSVAPHVQKTLELWEDSAKRVQNLKAKVTRQVFENGQQVEHRAEGELTYSSLPVIHCTLKPQMLESTEISQRTNSAGVPFELMPSPEEHWIYTPTETRFFQKPGEMAVVLWQQDQQVEWVSHEETQEFARTADLLIAPWRALFQVSAKKLAQRFEIRLNEQAHPVQLEFFPKRHDDIGQFSVMRVYLNPRDWQPHTVQLINKRGDKEMVYTFEYTEIVNHSPVYREPLLLPVRTEARKLEPAPTELHGQP